MIRPLEISSEYIVDRPYKFKIGLDPCFLCTFGALDLRVQPNSAYLPWVTILSEEKKLDD